MKKSVSILSGRVALDGDLTLPDGARGVVIFAHGSGSSRFSPRNQFVADELNTEGLGTLLVDLLTPQEEKVDIRTRELRFDIALLADRLISATRWLAEVQKTASLAVGHFGASTGGGAALVAAAEIPDLIGAVVSRGGRPDLAGESLLRVKAPTLLLVGSRDEVVVQLNRQAFQALKCEKELHLVDGATHLFEEPGALQEVARLAGAWFKRHLVAPSE